MRIIDTPYLCLRDENSDFFAGSPWHLECSTKNSTKPKHVVFEKDAFIDGESMIFNNIRISMEND